jgi:ribose 5-phosphate isomerase B
MTQRDESIIIGSDHGGYEMKEFIKTELIRRGFGVQDVGTDSSETMVDYPLYAARVARGVAQGHFKRGIALCGTGIGASITANRFRGVRAALCITPQMATLSREHNDANVLVMGGRITSREDAVQILDIWLTTPHQGGRHSRRIALIDDTAALQADSSSSPQ